MSDTLEHQLRDLFAEDAGSYDTTAALSRLRRLPRDQSSKRRTLWPAVGIGSISLTGIVVGLVLTFSSSAQVAYAFWSAVPKPATAQQIAKAAYTCGHGFTGSGAAASRRAFSKQPVLAEARRTSTALLEISKSRLYTCLMISAPQTQKPPWHVSVADHGKVLAAPRAGHISAPYALQSGVGWGNLPLPRINLAHATKAQIYNFEARHLGGGYGPYVVGQTGRGVRAVTFAFANGRTVSATVEHGWYFAWWPWTTRATTVTVTTASGSGNSPVRRPTNPRLFIKPDCRAHSTGCVFGRPADQFG